MARIQGWPHFRGPGVHCITTKILYFSDSIFNRKSEKNTDESGEVEALHVASMQCDAVTWRPAFQAPSWCGRGCPQYLVWPGNQDGGYKLHAYLR